MFYPLFAIIFLWIFADASRRGPSAALWKGWLLVLMLVPTWITARSGGLNLDIRTGAILAVLAGFLVAPQKGVFRRIVLGDVLFLLLIASMTISQYLVGPFSYFTFPEILRKWLLPYLMGRLFFRSTEDIDKALPTIAWLCLILSLFAMFESVAKFHPINKALGKTYGLLEQGEGYRMGLKRAQGPADHPIFFGMMLVMFFPWCVEAFRRARSKNGPGWWYYLPLLMGGALFGTVSRGPQLAAVFTFFATIFFRRPAWRMSVILCLLGLGATAYVYKDVVMDISAQISGEKDQEPKIILIDGEEVEYTGTKHRVLLFRVYDEAIKKVGWFGYGFSLRNVPIDPDQTERFGSIDNHYLLFLLQHGWLTVLTFLILGIVSILYLIKAAWNPALRQAGIAGSLAGALGAIQVMLLSVWFAPDFGTVWLFNIGLASSLHSLPHVPVEQEILSPAPEKPIQVQPAGRLRKPRLTRGYAPLRVGTLPKEKS